MKKLTINSTKLTALLKAASHVIAKNPIVPIINNLLIEVNTGIVTVSGTNLQDSIYAKSRSAIASHSDNFIFVLPKEAIKFIASIKDYYIEIISNQETNSIEIKYDDTVVTFKADEYGLFPKMFKPFENAFSVPDRFVKTICSYINHASFDELRPSMNGIGVKIKDNVFRMCATDGHRLKYEYIPSINLPESEFIIGRTAIYSLSKVISKISSSFQLSLSSVLGQILFLNGDIEICVAFRIIDDKFPDWERVLPQACNTTVNIPKSELFETLKIANLFANGATHQVVFSFNDQLYISAENFDFDKTFKRKISHFSIIGDKTKIGFNCRFMMDILTQIKSEYVTMQIEAPHKGVVMYGSFIHLDNDGFKFEQESPEKFLLMPVALNSYE